jgi:hypothetical protein
MDGIGKVLVGIAVVAIAASIAGYWHLTRSGQHKTVLVIAVMLYVASFAIAPGRSRELHGLVGILRIAGFVGVLFGIAGHVSRLRPR